jgi:hypothetical protein
MVLPEVAGAIQEALSIEAIGAGISTDSQDRDADEHFPSLLSEPIDLSISTSVAGEWRVQLTVRMDSLKVSICGA